MTKSLSQQQFGATAKDYITSKSHAQGKSLDRMIAVAQPQPGWTVLDIATGAGHAAYAFAPHVKEVVASDITDEMLAIVAEQAQKPGLANIRTAHAKAESLPFEDASFDLVTCRIAPHHFDSIAKFLDEVRRVLKPDGILVMVDNVVPEGSVGDYVNAFERFRDPSHLRAWHMAEWREAFAAHGFKIAHEEEISKTMDFATWATRHDANMKAFLRAMLHEVTPAVRGFLDPQDTGGNLTFQLCEGLFVAKPTAKA